MVKTNFFEYFLFFNENYKTIENSIVEDRNTEFKMSILTLSNPIRQIPTETAWHVFPLFVVPLDMAMTEETVAILAFESHMLTLTALILAPVLEVHVT